MTLSSSLTKVALKVAVFVIGMSAPISISAAPGRAFNGFYAGAMGGYIHSEARFSAESRAEYESFFHERGLIASELDDAKTHRYHAGGAFNFGYGQQIGKCMFLAGEVFLSWADRDTSIKGSAYNEWTEDHTVSLTTKTNASMRNFEFAVDLRPGFIVDSCTLVYGRVGVGYNKIRSKNSADFEFNGLGGQSITTLSQAKKRDKAALRLGAGAERKISCNLSLTSDYIFTYYGKVKTKNIGDSTFANGEDDNVIPDGFRAASSAKVCSQAVMFGVKYYFGSN